MIVIQLPRQQWGKAWRAMVEVAPVRLIGSDPLYEVLPQHLEVLDRQGFAYKVVPTQPRVRKVRRHGTSD